MALGSKNNWIYAFTMKQNDNCVILSASYLAWYKGVMRLSVTH